MMKAKKPKILFFDIETTYVKAALFHLHEQRISHENVIPGEQFNIICICYKWLGESVVHSLTWDKKQNSEKMIREFAKVAESADIVIAHNGDKFDIRQINTQRLLHNQPPLDWPVSEDMLKLVRRTLALPSYRLDYIAKLLLGEGKNRMSIQDWIDVVEYNDKKALAKMVKYCQRDVQVMCAVWKKLNPHIPNKMHRGIFAGNDSNSCPSCGHSKAHSRGWIIYSKTWKRRFACVRCGRSFSRNATKKEIAERAKRN